MTMNVISHTFLVCTLLHLHSHTLVSAPISLRASSASFASWYTSSSDSVSSCHSPTNAGNSGTDPSQSLQSVVSTQKSKCLTASYCTLSPTLKHQLAALLASKQQKNMGNKPQSLPPGCICTSIKCTEIFSLPQRN